MLIKTSVSMSRLRDHPGIITPDEFTSMVQNGNVSDVISVLKNPKKVVDEVSDDFDDVIKEQVMKMAIDNDNLPIVKILYKSYRDFYFDLIETDGLIQYAVERSRYSIVWFLLIEKPDERVINDQWRRSPLYREILWTAIDCNNLEMVDTILDSGWNIYWSVNDVAFIARNFGIEKSISLLARLDPSRIRNYSNFLDTMVRWTPNSHLILEWMRDHGWPMQVETEWGSHYARDMISNLSFKGFEILLSKDSTGERWWRHNYSLFNLAGMAQKARNEDNLDVKNEIVQIIELCIRNVQNEDEQAYIDQFVSDYPEYEALERSFAP